MKSMILLPIKLPFRSPQKVCLLDLLNLKLFLDTIRYTGSFSLLEDCIKKDLYFCYKKKNFEANEYLCLLL